jgi:hypothetical protein
MRIDIDDERPVRREARREDIGNAKGVAGV